VTSTRGGDGDAKKPTSEKTNEKNVKSEGNQEKKFLF
jgi:hypothetical protein